MAAAAPKRAARRWPKRAALIAMGLAVLVGLALAWMPDPVIVDVGEVEVGPLMVTVAEDGVTRVVERYEVTAPIAGMLLRIALDEGDAITEGQVIARIVPSPSPLLDPQSRSQAEAEVKAARAALQRARANVSAAQAAAQLARSQARRAMALLEAGAIAKEEQEQAVSEAQVRQEELAGARFAARAAVYELELAQAALQRAGLTGGEVVPVRAPVSGVVLRVLQESSGTLTPGTPLVELGNPDLLEVVVDVLTMDAVHIEPAAPAVVEDWGGGAALQAHVTRIEPSAFTRISALGVEEQRVNVILEIDAPRADWQQLGDGYRVEAKIRVWRGDDVLKAPASAVFRLDDGWGLFALRGGRAQLLRVNVGRRNEREVQLLTDLAPGTLVIEHPSDRVADDVRVQVRDEPVAVTQ